MCHCPVQILVLSHDQELRSVSAFRIRVPYVHGYLLKWSRPYEQWPFPLRPWKKYFLTPYWHFSAVVLLYSLYRAIRNSNVFCRTSIFSAGGRLDSWMVTCTLPFSKTISKSSLMCRREVIVDMTTLPRLIQYWSFGNLMVFTISFSGLSASWSARGPFRTEKHLLAVIVCLLVLMTL